MSASFVSPGSPDYDYHLSDSSSALDQAVGSPETLDMDGEARPADEASDIGADEHVPEALVLNYSRPDPESLRLFWRASSSLMAQLDHFTVVVLCEQGASPPDQGSCGSPIGVGQETSLTLTGLTTGEEYTVSLSAWDASGGLLAPTEPVGAIPYEVYRAFLPLVLGR
jgi:hypothetical protein